MTASDLRGPTAVIVGTPRSGTTLVQRVMAERCGIVIPPETHVLSAFTRAELRPRDFPLTGDRLRAVVARYAQRGWVEVDEDEVIDALSGRCDGPASLLSAVVGVATGWAARRGEKTPAHLRWVPYLRVALPETKIVMVVRDPRAVVASVLERRWSTGSVAGEALRWRLDQRRSLDRLAARAPEQVLVIRYEDLVNAPEAQASRLAGFVGEGSSTTSGALRRPAETWKTRAEGPIDPSRIDAWRDALDAHDERIILAITARRARKLGYDLRVPSLRALGTPRAADLRAIGRIIRYNLRTRAVVGRFVAQHRRRRLI